MSTEAVSEEHSASPNRAKTAGSRDQGGSANWEEFFHGNGWVEGDKIHCPDELIFELRFADGYTTVVYPASNLGEGHEVAPQIIHGVLTFKNGTDVFYYPWSMLASVCTKLNPRRAKKVQAREYAVDSGAEGVERRIRNSADYVIEPPASEKPKTVATPPVEVGPDGVPRRQFSSIDPNAPSWTAGGKDEE